MSQAWRTRAARVGASLTVLGVFAYGAASAGIGVLPAKAETESREDALTRFGEVYGLLQNAHVSGVTDELLTDAAIQGMIASLKDPYTVYYTKEQYESFTNDLDMVYVGIGTRLSQDNKGIRIIEVFEGGAAAQAGIVAGDYITEVNSKSTQSMSLDEVSNAIRGQAGTEVSITVLRQDESSKKLQLVRSQVTLSSVTSQVLSDGTGYMQVTGFTDTTDESFATQLEQLQKQAISRLVVDLRDNPGGILETAQHMAEQFIPEGTLIHTKDRNGVDEPVLLKGGKSVSIPVVFLVNENSASASEVLTGALQDYGKAKIVGQLTYGKGSVQSIYRLSSGGAMKVTIEQYFSPKGKAVNHVGITPDVQVEGNVPQLITALREAGSADVDVKLGQQSVQVNGLKLADKQVPLKLAGRLYVPARLLASLVGGKVEWNEQKQAVAISPTGAEAGNAAVDYGSGSGYVNQDGVGYLDVAMFQQQFQELAVDATEEGVSLHVHKEAGKENR